MQFFKKEILVTGIDIGSHAIKVCQVKRAGKDYEIISTGSARLPSGVVEDGVLQEPNAVSDILSKLLTNLKIKNKKVGISVSGYSVIVKKINFEEMNDEDLYGYVKSEAEQYIPFDIEDVYIDFQKIPSRKLDTERCEILLVAAKKEVVNDYLNMLTQLKLDTVLVDVDDFALENIWEAISGGAENVVLVDIGASKMSINIISERVSVLARDVALGSGQLTEQIVNSLGIDYEQAEKIKLGAEPVVEQRGIVEDIFNKTCTYWVSEIKKAIDFYLASNPDKPLVSIVLSGGGSKVNGLRDWISSETGLNVIAFNPFSRMLYNKKLFDKQYLDTVGPEMAIATGIAIRTASF